MTVSEFFQAAVLSAVQNPVETAAIQEEWKQNPEGNLDIRLVRHYPVYKWETEAQARKRVIAEEAEQL